MNSFEQIIKLFDEKGEFLSSFTSSLYELLKIWETIGISGRSLANRREVVMLHLTNLLNEMVKEEKSMSDKIMTNIDSLKSSITQLSSMLGRPNYEESQHLTILELEKELRSYYQILEKEKSDRQHKVNNLMAIDQKLCDELCTTPYYIPTGSIPTEEQFSMLEKHIAKLKIEKEQRLTTFKNLKSEIIKLLEKLELEPNSSFEKEVIYEDSNLASVTSENMKLLQAYHNQLCNRFVENNTKGAKLKKQLETLWEQLNTPQEERIKYSSLSYKPKDVQALQEEVNRCKLLKMANVQSIIGTIRAQLSKWWDKCYISDEEKMDFHPYYSENLTEELLEQHEQEIRKMKRYYKSHQTIFEKISLRDGLWEQFLEFENKASDPNRLFSKDWNLLSEEKARKKLMKQLPKIEQEIELEIDTLNKNNGETFLVRGSHFVDYVNHQWEEYRTKKKKVPTATLR